MNHIFLNLLSAKIQRFRASFVDTAPALFKKNDGSLLHPGEFGEYREDICEEFLSTIIPKKLRIGSGFLINTNGDIGTQSDLIIFDNASTPHLETDDKRKFYTVESVVAIGEVKSTLSKEQFTESLLKLANNKKIKEGTKTPTALYRSASLRNTPYNPCLVPYDQIFSFIICKKLNFNLENIHKIIDESYGTDVEYRNRHNLILSIDDGLLAYRGDLGGEVKTLMFPFMQGTELKNRFILSDKSDCHFYFFASYLFMACSSGTILYPDLVDYIGHFQGGFNIDQKD